MASRGIRWLVGVGVALAAAGGLAAALWPRPVAVDAAPAVVDSMRLTVDEEGRTRIRERYVVSSPLTGRIRRIALDPGDEVFADATVVAVLEPTDPSLLDARAVAEAEARVRAAEAAVRRADAALTRANAAYDIAEIELGRVTEAFRDGAATELERDRARAEERAAGESRREAAFSTEIARFEMEVAQSALLYARGEVEPGERVRWEVPSPIDGVVLRVFRESAAVVGPGTPLVEIGDPRDLEIVIDVLSTDGVNIEPGQRVIITQWGKPEPLEAVVRLVEPSAFTKTSALGIEEQRVNVIADFVSPPSERATLGDGFRVEASIVTWESGDALVIPSSALFRDGDSWAVFAVERGRAALRRIEVGAQSERFAQVVAGLEPGDLVVPYPSDRLADGIRVRVRVGD